MALRPARTCRDLDKVAWTRFSKKKPRKSYIRALPHLALVVYNMGNKKKDFDTQFDLVAVDDVQIRDNSLESARQAINKHLEKHIAEDYRVKVLVFPHNVIRENKMISGAGADRLQKGMRASFGRPTRRAARIHKKSPVFRIWTDGKNADLVKEACRRARCKMPGNFRLEATEINN